MDSDEKLLKEYETCQNSANNVEGPIWSSGGILGIGSIGVAIVLFTSKGNVPVYVVSLIGFFIIWLMSIWQGIVDRWLSIQHAKFKRMEDIENSLNLKTHAFIGYLNKR